MATAIKNGSAETCNCRAMLMPMGAISTTVAALLIKLEINIVTVIMMPSKTQIG